MYFERDWKRLFIFLVEKNTYMIFLKLSKAPKKMLDVCKLEKVRKHWIISKIILIL